MFKLKIHKGYITASKIYQCFFYSFDGLKIVADDIRYKFFQLYLGKYKSSKLIKFVKKKVELV